MRSSTRFGGPRVSREPMISPDHLFYSEVEDALGLHEPQWTLHGERPVNTDILFAEEQELERAFGGSMAQEQLRTPVMPRQRFRQTPRLHDMSWEQPPKPSSTSSCYYNTMYDVADKDSMDNAALMPSGMWNNHMDMSQSQISSNSTHPPANLQRSLWQLWRCQGDLSSEVVAQSAQLRTSEEEASCWRTECNLLKSELMEREYKHFTESRMASPRAMVPHETYAPLSSSSMMATPTRVPVASRAEHYLLSPQVSLPAQTLQPSLPLSLPMPQERATRGNGYEEPRLYKEEASGLGATDATSKISARTISDKMAELLALRRKMHALVDDGAVLGVRTSSPARGGLETVLRDLQRDSQERLGELRQRDATGTVEPKASAAALSIGSHTRESPSAISEDVHRGNEIASAIEEIHRNKYQLLCNQHAAWDERAPLPVTAAQLRTGL